MRSTIRRSCALPALAILLAGCSSSTDPHEGGFFGGVSGLSSGAYEQRQSDLHNQLAAANYDSAQLNARAAQLDAQQHDLDGRIAAASAQMAHLSDELTVMHGQIAEEERLGKIDRARRVKLQDEIESLGRSITLAKAANARNPDELNNTLAALTQRYEALKQTLAKSLAQ